MTLITYLSDKYTAYLEALERYQFATTEQLVRLGVSSSKVVVNRVVKEMRDRRKPLVQSLQPGMASGNVRLPNLHYLAPEGVRCLAALWDRDEEGIQAPKSRRVVIGQDYLHRIATVDVHIAASLWANQVGGRLDFFHTYFQGIGANRTAKDSGQAYTKLSKVVLNGGEVFFPDALLSVSTLLRPEPYLFALEVYRGKDTRRVIDQMEQHIQAIEQGAIGRLYGLEIDHRVLLIFETEAAMQAVLKRALQEKTFAGLEECFLFSTLERVQAGFADGWRSLVADGEIGFVPTKVHSWRKQS